MAVLATFTAEQYDKYHMFTFRPLCYLLVTAFPAAVVAVWNVEWLCHFPFITLCHLMYIGNFLESLLHEMDKNVCRFIFQIGKT